MLVKGATDYKIMTSVFKIRSETCRTAAQFWQNLYMTTKERLPDRCKFCRSGSAVRHLFWRLWHECMKESWPRLNIKTIFPRYEDSHVKNKTVTRPYYVRWICTSWMNMYVMRLKKSQVTPVLGSAGVIDCRDWGIWAEGSSHLTGHTCHDEKAWPFRSTYL